MRVTARSVCTAAMVCVCLLTNTVKTGGDPSRKKKRKKNYIIEYLSVKHHIIVTCKL